MDLKLLAVFLTMVVFGANARYLHAQKGFRRHFGRGFHPNEARFMGSGFPDSLMGNDSSSTYSSDYSAWSSDSYGGSMYSGDSSYSSGDAGDLTSEQESTGSGDWALSSESTESGSPFYDPYYYYYYSGYPSYGSDYPSYYDSEYPSYSSDYPSYYDNEYPSYSSDDFYYWKKDKQAIGQARENKRRGPVSIFTGLGLGRFGGKGRGKGARLRPAKKHQTERMETLEKLINELENVQEPNE